MVWQQQETHKQPEYKQLKIGQPGYGGLNMKDLDFMLRTNESPKMLNMMVKDGVFKKRYGQKNIKTTWWNDEGTSWENMDLDIWAQIKPVMFEFNDLLYVMYARPKATTSTSDAWNFYIDVYDQDDRYLKHALSLSGDSGMDTGNYYMVLYDEDGIEFYDDVWGSNVYTTYNIGFFFISNGNLYCMATYPGYANMDDGGKSKFCRLFVYAKLDETSGNFIMMNHTKESDIYVPTVAINIKPDATYYDADGMDEFNILNPRVKLEYNGDGTSETFKIPTVFKNAHFDYVLSVKVNGTTTAFTRGDGAIRITPAPAKGQNNVTLTLTTSSDTAKPKKEFYKYEYSKMACEILGAQFCTSFGGANNSRLFVGGASDKYFFSEVNDPSYFPAVNYGTAGYDGQKITGFGHHYNDLIVFKKNSIYSLKYQYGADSTGNMRGLIYSQPVNLEIGCDAPNTIRKVNNRLTWLSTEYGVCTLVSTVLEDERNVCTVSRNVETGDKSKGLLDEANEFSFAIDYAGKYIVFNNQRSDPPGFTDLDGQNVTNTYVWDYSLTPFFLSEKQSVEESARNTSWFVWDKIIAIAVKRYKGNLYTIDFVETFDEFSKVSRCGMRLTKFIEEPNDFGGAINAYYQTPIFDFTEYGYLKTVRKIFVLSRGDKKYNTTLKYLTDENETGETDPENLVNTATSNFPITFARKCSLKKIETASLMFSNNKAGYDMPIDGIQLMYTLVKEIK